MNAPKFEVARSHRQPALTVDPVVATCQILAPLAPSAISGDLAREVLEHLTRQNEALTSAPEEEITSSLIRQATLLDALFLHFAARAATAERVDYSVALNKAALNCQRALMTVQGTIHQLAETKRKAGALEHVGG